MNSRTIPVINATNPGSDETLRTLDAACRNWGIFHVVEHNIDKQLLSDLLQVTRDFFHQTAENKRELSRTLENHWGFYDRELTKNIRDLKEVYDYGPEQNSMLKPQWPLQLPQFKNLTLNAYRAFEQLAFQLIKAIVSNLGETFDSVATQFQPQHTSFLRLNYYPSRPDNNSETVPGSEHQLGINPHTDAGALTVLLQDQQAGLQVFKDGHWHKIAPVKDALLVNIGDVMQVWSNDRYPAPLHRVYTEPKLERISVPFFLNPAYQGQYQPLPATISSDNPPHYHPINWQEFREKRAAGDYADFGEEIQISHFRIERN